MPLTTFFRFACLGFFLFVVGCVETTDTQNRFDKISTAYCECTARLVALNQEADTAGEARLNIYFKKMQEEYIKAKECTATIIGQFGQLKPEELDSVNLLLSTKCPDLQDQRDLLQELLGE